MFTTPCFIRMNTQELREKLENLGYKNRNQDYYRGNALCTLSNKSVYGGLDSSSEHPEYMTFTIDLDFVKYIAPSEDMIDCHKNKDLFLALAALRDDNDYMQWFVNDKWYLCEDFDWGLSLDMHSPVDMDFAHKASADEIIDYFNK